MHTEHGADDEFLDAEGQDQVGPETDEATENVDASEHDEEQSRRPGGRRRRRGAVWAFFHPPEAAWAAPGERQVRSAGDRLTQRLGRSRGLAAAVAAGAVIVMVLVLVVGWALSRPSDEPGASPDLAATAEASTQGEAEQLPGSQGQSGAGGEKTGPDAGPEQPEPSGQSADEATLERINAGEGLVTARAQDEEDPLVTGARFLRSLRSTDTTSDEVSDWYAARDSFLAEGQPGTLTDWGEAGEKDAVSAAEISWAEMDATIEDGRGIAPDFPYGEAAQPGTHLVQVGMRLDRQVSAGNETVDTPSGALMEAVVVCPPAAGVDRCVVTRWAEEPAGFTGLRDESWEIDP